MLGRHSYTEPLVPIQRELSVSKQNWNTLKIAITLIFCACFIFASLRFNDWATIDENDIGTNLHESEVASEVVNPPSSSVPTTTKIIGVGTWNVLDKGGTYSPKHGINTEIERRNELAEDLKDTLDAQRMTRVVNQMKAVVKQENLEVLGIQELDDAFAAPVKAAMEAEGYTQMSHVGENALFVKNVANGGSLTPKAGCSFEFNFPHDKWKTKGARVIVFETACTGQTVAFCAMHVKSKMAKENGGANVGIWANNFKDAITGALGDAECKPDHIVVLADFNTELNDKAAAFSEAGWTSYTVPQDAPFPFTTEHQHGEELSIDGFLTMSPKGGTIGWDGQLKNVMKGFMSKAYAREGDAMKRESVYSYNDDDELLRSGTLVPGNKRTEPMSDHLLVYGNLQLSGCTATEQEVADY